MEQLYRDIRAIKKIVDDYVEQGMKNRVESPACGCGHIKVDHHVDFGFGPYPCKLCSCDRFHLPVAR
jgi:hypothetical protein